jgi:hypothetical protein
MPDMSAIAAALSSLKAAKDIAQAMIGLRDAAAFQEKQIEFQSKLLDANNAAFAAQEERSAMLERISELEKEVTRLEAWEAEKQRYELKPLAAGSFAYTLKTEAQGTEPPHHICTRCYEHQQKSILQKVETSLAGTHMRIPPKYRCPECKSEFVASQ